jgi:hypothetical protein
MKAVNNTADKVEVVLDNKFERHYNTKTVKNRQHRRRWEKHKKQRLAIYSLVCYNTSKKEDS